MNTLSNLAACITCFLAFIAAAAGTRHRVGSPTPIVVWHGMGDTCCNNDTMGYVARIIEDEIPGVYIHSVRLGSSESADRSAGFFGNLNDQIEQVCSDLRGIDQLQQGVNLVGFSQGGLFLRALVQRCPSLKARVLVTFGSPHAGVASVPECEKEGDTLCQWMRQLAASGVYSWYIRSHVIQAQYFKDPARIDQYLKHNIFLPDINAEVSKPDDIYRGRLLGLRRLVMVKFSDDSMIYPRSSSWFGYVDQASNEIPLQNTTLYTDDLLGLREMDQSGRLAFLTLEGKHMHITEAALRSIVSRYLATNKDSIFRVQY